MIHRTRLGISHWGKEMNSILGTISHPPTSSEWKMGNPKCRGDCGDIQRSPVQPGGFKAIPLLRKPVWLSLPHKHLH